MQKHFICKYFEIKNIFLYTKTQYTIDMSQVEIIIIFYTFAPDIFTIQIS